MPVIAATHTVAKTSPATHRFGAGIIPYTGRCMPYTQADLDAAAQMFADDAPEPDYDALAADSAYYDQFNGSFPEFGHCLLCGDRTADLTEQGLCDRCDVDACEKSTPNRSR